MLGEGLWDCMILKSDTRPFLKEELNYDVGMYGLHTGKHMDFWTVKIEPISNKF